MQLQFRSEYKKYLSKSGPSATRSNRLLGDMVRRGVVDNRQEIVAHIDKIVQFIEGGAQNEAALKKAQKRARQKQRKEEERRQREEEEEAQRRAEEERLRKEQELIEQQRLKEELALQKQMKKKKKQPAQPAQIDNKKKKGKENVPEPPQSSPIEMFEQTIPAMVTIKRIVENNNSPPTVTITLKGSTPDQDKLLYTLVNGHDAPVTAQPSTVDKSTEKQSKQVQKQTQSVQKQPEGKKKNKKGGATEKQTETKQTRVNNSNSATKNVQIQTSEIKVQLAIDNSFRKDVAKAKEKQAKELQAVKNKQQTSQTQAGSQTSGKVKKESKDEKKSTKEEKMKGTKEKNTSKVLNSKDVKTGNKEKEVKDALKKSTPSSSTSSLSPPEIIDIPLIKLPPGITITKVSGPVANRKTATALANDYPDVPVSKSGVIVVDTEKLIQQQAGTGTTTGTGSKKKKKKAKKAAAAEEHSSQNGCSKTEPRVLIKSSTTAGVAPSTGGIVTLKNPIFHPLAKPPMEMPHVVGMSDQATISHGENGMVTIRRHRPVGFMPTNESPLSEYLAKTQDVSKDGGAEVKNAAPSMETSKAPSTAMTMGGNANCSSTTTLSNPDILTPWQMPDTSFSVLSEERKIIRPPNLRGAQWPRNECENGKSPSVLQGLPGIQITRVPTGPPVVEAEYVEPPANVSIIRTGGCHVSEGPQSWAYPAQP